jgi:hypothetical protein
VLAWPARGGSRCGRGVPMAPSASVPGTAWPPSRPRRHPRRARPARPCRPGARPWRARTAPCSDRGAAQPRWPRRVPPPLPRPRRGGTARCPACAFGLGPCGAGAPVAMALATLARAAPSRQGPRPRRLAPPLRSLPRPWRGLASTRGPRWRARGGPAPALAQRGPCAARPQPGAASSHVAAVPLRSTARARLGPGVCAAHSRCVSVALRACVLAWCFGTARRALGVLVYP